MIIKIIKITKKKIKENKKRETERQRGIERIWNKGPNIVEEGEARRGDVRVLVVGLVGIEDVANAHVFRRGEVVHGS